MKEIKIPIYYYVDYDKTKVYDIESMQKDFDEKIDKLTNKQLKGGVKNGKNK